MAGETVRVVRAFNGTPLRVVINSSELSVEMALGDFIEQLAIEAAERLAHGIAEAAGSPAMLLTSAQLQRRLVEAVEPSDVAQALRQSADEIISSLKKASVVAQ